MTRINNNAHNIQFVLDCNSLKTHQIQIVGNKLIKATFVRTIFNWLKSFFTSEHKTQIKSLVDKNIQDLSKATIHLSTPKLLLLAQKLNRFVQNNKYCPLFQELNLKSPIEIQKKHKKFKVTKKEPLEDRAKLVQAQTKNNRYYYPNSSQHFIENFKIFATTQSKRIKRYFFPNTKEYQFFLGDDEKNIYKKDAPLASSNVPMIQNIGHATLLIQIDGMNIITDPVFNDASPLFYPRKTKPGLTLQELPPIDVIVISHNHRDHMELETLTELTKHQPIIFVPKGECKRMKNLGFEHVVECDWWEKTTITSQDKTTSVEITSTPANHWSRRSLFDANKSLFNGWVIKSTKHHGAIYFAGDTAKLDQSILDRIAQFNVTTNLQPSGPNYQREYQKSAHQSTADSIFTHFELSKSIDEIFNSTTILMHHQAYELGPDRFNEGRYIYQKIIHALRTGRTEGLDDFIKIVVEKLKKLDIDKEILIEALEKRIKMPRIGQRIELQHLNENTTQARIKEKMHV